MVTGQRMFSVTSSFSIMQAQVKEIPRQPMEIVTTLPKALNDAIMKAVSKDPAQRFQTADEFRDALLRIAAGDAPSKVLPSDAQPAAHAPGFDPGFTPPASPASQVNRSLLLLVGVVLVAALVAGDAVYKSHVQHKSDQPALDPTRMTTAKADTSAPNANQVAVTDAQPAASAATSASMSSSTAATSTTSAASSQPIAAVGKPKSQAAAQYPPAGPTAEEIQAQQQALLEQKRMLDALETELDHLDGRAASVESGLTTLEQQMHQDGLGLRGDMVAARGNMRNDIAKAKQAIDSGDTERTRHYLDLATHEVEKLEAFLGHR
jgi:serine/threonine-protein kinase